jgi:hypothetical protein
VNTTDEDDYHNLYELWSLLAHKQTSDELKHCAKILAQQKRKKGPGDDNNDPDAGLTAWLDAMPKEVIPEVLREGCVDTSLPEEARRRFWAQSKTRIGGLGCEWILKTIEQIFTNDDTEVLEEDVIGSAEEISNLCETDLRQELLRTILSSLVSTSSLQIKRKLANWLAEIEGQGILKNLANMTTSDDDVSILSELFPTDKNLKKLIKKQDGIKKNQ